MMVMVVMVVMVVVMVVVIVATIPTTTSNPILFYSIPFRATTSIECKILEYNGIGFEVVVGVVTITTTITTTIIIIRM